MSQPSYAAVLYIEDSSNFTLAAAAKALEQPGRPRLTDDKQIDLTFKRFRLTIALEDTPDTVEVIQSSFPAEETNDPRAERAKRCRRRIYLWSRDRDDDMDHFNDYVITIGILEDAFPGLIPQDDASGNWI